MDPRYAHPRPRFEDDIVKTQRVEAGRKSFDVTLRKNHAGEFVKVVEFGAHGPRGSVIVPIEGINDFIQALQFVTVP
jgi:hypothetical protein